MIVITTTTTKSIVNKYRFQIETRQLITLSMWRVLDYHCLICLFIIIIIIWNLNNRCLKALNNNISNAINYYLIRIYQLWPTGLSIQFRHSVVIYSFIYLFILEDSVLDDLREIETFGVSREQMNLMSVKVKQKTAGNEINWNKEKERDLNTVAMNNRQLNWN